MGSSSRSRRDVDRPVRALALVLVGVGMTWLAFQENSLLISERVSWRAQAGGIVLLLLGLVETVQSARVFFRSRRLAIEPNEPDEHGHNHHGRPRLWPLLLPLVLFPAAARSDVATLARNKLFLPSDAVEEPVVASQRGESEQSGVVSAERDPAEPYESPESLGELLGYTEETLPADATTVLTVDNFFEITEIAMENPDFVRGRRFRLSGFVYRDESWPPNDFVVGRLLIWCCAADTSLVGMYVRTQSPAPPEDTWVEVEGPVDVISDFVDPAGGTREMPVVVVETIREIDEPEEFYVVPTF